MIHTTRPNYSFNIRTDGSIENIEFIFYLSVLTFCRVKTSLCRSNPPMQQPARMKSVFLYVRLSYSVRNTIHKQVEFFHTNSGLLLKEVKKLTSFFHYRLLYLCFLWERPSLCRNCWSIGIDGRSWMSGHLVNSMQVIFPERSTYLYLLMMKGRG